MVASQYPAHVAKSILSGRGPFEEHFAASALEARLSRLGDQENAVFIANLMTLSDPEATDKDAALAVLGSLVAKTDAYDPIEEKPDLIQYRGDIFQKVWEEAAEMRRSGELLALGIKSDAPEWPFTGITIPTRPKRSKRLWPPSSGIFASFSLKTAATNPGSNGRQGMRFSRC